MDGRDLALLAVSGYVAITALVRLMSGERDRLLARFRAEMEAEKARLKNLAQKPTEPAKRPPGRNSAA